MKKRNVWITILLIFALSLGLLLPIQKANAFPNYNEEQKLLLQSWRLVNQSYLDDTFNDQNWWFVRQELLNKSLSNREETYTAIEEMLALLDDPFTRLLKPDQYQSLQINTSGELSGVGLQININPETGFLEVVAPLSGSPAEAAGIQAHDRIIAIDGEDTSSLTLEEAANRMRGVRGTNVSLTINPSKDQEENAKTYQLIRDVISLNPVISNFDDSGNVPIGYLHLSQFSANAAEEIQKAIEELEAKGAEGYILDLRNNPGGLLQAGIEIAQMWLDSGAIVYTVNRQGVMGSFDASGEPLTKDPLVVLVNQGSASASEILAGALQDNGRALLVGEQTFGKGLIQSLFQLDDGSGLAITVAKYETPNHKDIHKLGIAPDRVVSQESITYGEIGSEADLQYQEALKLLTTDSAIADAEFN